MGILFISHSSQNNDRAIQIRDWLREQGWRDTSLDLDPEHGPRPRPALAGGAEEGGRALLGGDRARLAGVDRLALVRDRVPAGDPARQPRLPGPDRAHPFAELPVELTAHFQMTDMSQRATRGLNRLRIGLRRAGRRDPPAEPKRPGSGCRQGFSGCSHQRSAAGRGSHLNLNASTRA